MKYLSDVLNEICASPRGLRLMDCLRQHQKNKYYTEINIDTMYKLCVFNFEKK